MRGPDDMPAGRIEPTSHHAAQNRRPRRRGSPTTYQIVGMQTMARRHGDIADECQKNKNRITTRLRRNEKHKRGNAEKMACIFWSTQSGLPRGLKGVISCNLLIFRNRWWPHQPHPGTRVPRLGCYLPVLTRLTSYQCERTNGTTGEENRQTGLPMQWLSARRRTVRLIFQQSAEWIS